MTVGQFLSTPSARRATAYFHDYIYGKAISIHALREEGDTSSFPQFSLSDDFYPRPPRGGRPTLFCTNLGALSFLSTPSARRATYVDLSLTNRHFISIHALREEGDGARTSEIQLLFKFLSTPSARRATCGGRRLFGRFRISIHALREEGDCDVVDGVVLYDKFLSTPSARRATAAAPLWSQRETYFYPRPPRGGRLVAHVSTSP